MEDESIDGLSDDLIICLMERSLSIRDLYNFSKASRRFRSIFNAYSTQLLNSVKDSLDLDEYSISFQFDESETPPTIANASVFELDKSMLRLRHWIRVERVWGVIQKMALYLEGRRDCKFTIDEGATAALSNYTKKRWDLAMVSLNQCHASATKWRHDYQRQYILRALVFMCLSGSEYLRRGDTPSTSTGVFATEPMDLIRKGLEWDWNSLPLPILPSLRSEKNAALQALCRTMILLNRLSIAGHEQPVPAFACPEVNMVHRLRWDAIWRVFELHLLPFVEAAQVILVDSQADATSI